MPPEHALVTFYFEPAVDLDEVDGTLQLSRMAAESLYGADRLRLEPVPRLDLAHRTCATSISSQAGRSLAAIFVGYARREFGDGAFRVLSPSKGAA